MANPFYLKAKEAILHDMTDFDSNKAYHGPPMPGAGCLITAMGQKPFPATVTQVVQTFEANGTKVFILDWLSTDGTLRGTSNVAASWLATQPPGPLKLNTILSMIKTYSHPDQHWNVQPGSFFSYQSNSGTPNPYAPPHYTPKAEAQVDLSQIAADLAKLPKSPPWEQSPLSSMKEALLSPMEFAEKYGAASASGGADLGLITGEDIKAAMEKLSETTGKAFSNTEKMMQATQEQMASFGGVFLEAVSGEVIPIGTGDFKLALHTAPIGKVTDLKETPLGLEATFSTELVAKPKKIESKKLQEANAQEVMKKAVVEAASTLWGGLYHNPWPDKMNTLNGVHTFQLADGTMLEVLLTVKPKEVKP